MSLGRVRAFVFSLAGSVIVACGHRSPVVSNDSSGDASGAATLTENAGQQLRTVVNGQWFWGQDLHARISGARDWNMVGPLPTHAGADDRLLPREWQSHSAANASSSTLVTTEQIDCFARQHGSFFARHGGWPSAAIESFVMGRCGLVATRPYVFHRLVPAKADIETATAVRSEVRHALAETPPGWRVAYHRADHGGATLHTVVYAEPLGHVDSYVLAREPGERLTITGRLLPGYEGIRAASTLGTVGWNGCRFRVKPRTGEFSLRCIVDWTRDDTFIEATYVGADSSTTGRAQTLRFYASSGEPTDRFALPRIDAGAPEQPIDRSSLLEAINGARFRAGVTRVAEDPARSVSASRLWHDDGAPNYERIADLAYMDLSNDPRSRTSGVAVWRSASHISATQLVEESFVQPLTRAWLLSGASRLALSVRKTAGEMSTNVLLVSY